MPLNLTRSILGIFIPGIVAIAPWLFVFFQLQPDLAAKYLQFQPAIHAAAFTVVVVAGTLFEALGNYIELAWDRIAGEEDAPDKGENWLEKDWYDYLACQVGGGEPVGFRYLSRKVTSLYFELGMLCGAPLGLCGIVAFIVSESRSGWTPLVYALPLFAFYGFRKTAMDTHVVLYQTRFRLNERIRANSQLTKAQHQTSEPAPAAAYPAAIRVDLRIRELR